MTERDAARAAKSHVRELCQGHASVNGIGLRRDDEVGWVVKVNLVDEDEGLRQSIPALVDGVRVDITVVGPVHAATD